MKNLYEFHFCEGSYFMAKIVGNENAIIDNTFTEFIGEFLCTQEECHIILNMLEKAKDLEF